MDDVAAPPPLQRGLEQADEVLRLLLDLDLAVAQHAEDALRDDRETGKQPVEEQRDHLLDRQKPDAAAGQPDKAIDRGRDQDQRLQPLAVADPVELQRQTEAAIGDKRKRMRRIERQRRQHREQIGHEALVEPGAVARFEIGRLDHRDPGLGKLGAQRHPGHLLRFHQRAGALVDRFELLPRGQPVLAQRLDAGEALAFEAGDAHHVELVEIARRDRQKAQPFQQRMARVLGLGQNALVERQPGQLAVDKARRRRRVAGPDIDDLRALAHRNPPPPLFDMAGGAAGFSADPCEGCHARPGPPNLFRPLRRARAADGNLRGPFRKVELDARRRGFCWDRDRFLHCRGSPENDRALRRQHAAIAVRDRDLGVLAPGARRIRRAAGAPPRSAETARTCRDGSRTARRHWC